MIGQRTEKLKGAEVPRTSGATAYLFVCRDCWEHAYELVKLVHAEDCPSLCRDHSYCDMHRYGMVRTENLSGLNQQSLRLAAEDLAKIANGEKSPYRFNTAWVPRDLPYLPHPLTEREQAILTRNP